MAAIKYSVGLIPQESSNTCWYAAARMLVSWYREKTRQTTFAGGAVGEPDVTNAVNVYNRPMIPSEVSSFAERCGLRMAHFELTSGIALDLLRSYGPFIYGGRYNGYRELRGSAGHCVVVTGIRIDDVVEIAVNDPLPILRGTRLYLDFDVLRRGLPFFGFPIIHI